MSTLYNTYRPSTFNDIIGQKNIIKALTNAIDRNIISHAYLFTGPHGTGKTTIARVLAHAINCTNRDNFTPCNDNICKEISKGSSIDIMEIDAASYTSVDNIRQLRETVILPPSRTHYKIYIIDEAHMLSKAAWNAFLKTLEEPPKHAIFMFATTEVNKVPDTILSRVQRFDLKHISLSAITKKLDYISKKEALDIDNEALQMIAQTARGSMRDAETLLAQISTFTTKKITTQDVHALIGITKQDTILTFVEEIVSNNTMSGIQIIDKLVENGTNFTLFTTSLLTTLHHILRGSVDTSLITTCEVAYTTQDLDRICKLSQTPLARIIEIIDVLTSAKILILQSSIDQLPLETALVKLTNTKSKTVHMPVNTPKKIVATSKENIITVNELTKAWPKIITLIKKENSSLAMILQQNIPFKVNKNTATIAVSNDIFKQKIESTQFQLTLHNAIATICDVDMHILASVEEKAPSSTLIANAMSVMNGSKIVTE